jgi:hypothetical protein
MVATESRLSERKPRMRRFRAIIVFVLAAVILSAPLASAAPIRPAKPRVERSLLSSIGDLLAVVWQKAGCSVDPWGTKAGARMDPLGDPQPENLDAGCGIDPLGGCRSGS